MSSRHPSRDAAWFAALILAGPLLVLPAMLAAAIVAVLWPLAYVIRQWLRSAGVKATERNRAQAAANARRQRISTALQMQLAAHGLMDTPENRAHVLTQLGRRRTK